MLFEKGPADILIQGKSKVTIQCLDSFSDDSRRHRVLNCITEEHLEPLQGVLIHGVND